MLEKFVYRKLLDLHALGADCEDPQVWSRLHFSCAHHASLSAYSNAHKLACGVDFSSAVCVLSLSVCVRAALLRYVRAGAIALSTAESVCPPE